ncbi:hypothetical protein [Actinomadura macra]|uniref:hypothetical protein n=1 Tax=Actinomadura macra TaxID=46164 RepID=UPI000AA7CE68|nr:hypothetical protein [Actinomadura macra]
MDSARSLIGPREAAPPGGAPPSCCQFLIPLYYQQVKGHGALSAGLLLVPQGIGAFFGMPIAGRLSFSLPGRPGTSAAIGSPVAAEPSRGSTVS